MSSAKFTAQQLSDMKAETSILQEELSKRRKGPLAMFASEKSDAKLAALPQRVVVSFGSKPPPYPTL